MNNLKLLVESFTSTEERRHQICAGLNISEASWTAYSLHHKDVFMKTCEMKKTLGFAISVMKIREFNTLKACMIRWMENKKVRANVTIFREAKRVIDVCRLHYLKTHWEPSENEKWFIANVLCGKQRPVKKFRLLYEWVEDEVVENGSILASEVRYQVGVLVGENFGQYKSTRSLQSLASE